MLKDGYFELRMNPVNLSVGGFKFSIHGRHALTSGQVINDFLMALLSLMRII